MPTLPPRNPTVETLQKQIDDLRREIRLMKERPHREDIPYQRRTEVVFSCPGDVPVDARSGSYLLKDFTATIHRLDISAGVVGSADSTYQVLVDGAVVYEDVFPAGEAVMSYEDLAVEVEDYSQLAVNWSVVGAGLSTVVMTFQVVAIEGEEYD